MCRKNFLCVTRVEALKNALARFAVVDPTPKGHSSLQGVGPILGGLPAMPVQAAIAAGRSPARASRFRTVAVFQAPLDAVRMHRTFNSSAIARGAVAPLATAESLVLVAGWLLCAQTV
jgi:hypothetical protein